MATSKDKNKRGVSDKMRDGKTTKTVNRSTVSGSMLSSASGRGKYSDKTAATSMSKEKPRDKKPVPKQSPPEIQAMSNEKFNKLLEKNLKAHKSTWIELAKR